jgi:hypothetical protein
MVPVPGICGWRGCTSGKPALHRPVLFFRSPIDPSTPAHAAIGLVVCDDCKQHCTVEYFVTDKGWQSFKALFTAIGKAAPARALTTLEFKDANDPQWALPPKQ